MHRLVALLSAVLAVLVVGPVHVMAQRSTPGPSGDRDVHRLPGAPRDLRSAGYYTIDECLSSLQPGAFGQYQRLRTLDPGSMTFAALLGDLEIVLWRDSADVLASDPYPLFGPEPTCGHYLAQVAARAARAQGAVNGMRGPS